MARSNNSLDLVSLDFDTLKTSLKTYLQNQNQFKDYDYEGSNMSVLMDLLSYNTTKNAFYVNMALTEMFMDSARLRGSITSHAKELNYLPTSRKSASANVTVSFEASGDSQPYVIPRGSLFSSVVKDQSYAFSTSDAITTSSSNNAFEFTANIYQGFYVRDSYIYTNNDATQTFKLTNKNVDTDSLIVSVYEDGSETAQLYTKKTTLLGVDSNDKIYFIQGTGDGYYEILFGDGVFGQQPKVNSLIVLEYRNSDADVPNGATTFSMDFDPTGASEMTEYTITTNENASGGAERQTIESIRKLAPRWFATQERAVASDDYASIILSQFSGKIADVNVYGGETVEPKRYGRVIVALKPVGADIASNFVKSEVENFMLKYVSIPTRIIIEDPEYLYGDVTTTVQFDQATTSKSATEIKSLVTNAITTYSDDNLETFDSDFRYSRFVKEIDDTDGSITSNDTTVRLTKRLKPLINALEFFELDYNNAFHEGRLTINNNPVITSTLFTYRDEAGTDYENAFIRDNGAGVLVLRAPINNIETTINATLGTVDYDNGLININGMRASSYTNHISLYASMRNKDIIVSKNKIFQITGADVTVNVIETLN